MEYQILPGHTLTIKPQHRIVRAFPDVANGGVVYPVIWSGVRESGYICVFLLNEKGKTGISFLSKRDYEMLPFCEVEW